MYFCFKRFSVDLFPNQLIEYPPRGEITALRETANGFGSVPCLPTYLPITTLHLMPAGILLSGLGSCSRTPMVPLAASITLSTTTTFA